MPPGFEAHSILGKGAMGKVYKAWQPKLQRYVAVKTCNIKESQDAGQDPGRLEDEALTIARLNHPNIVSLYDVYRDEEAIYLIMELLEGPPVSKFLNKRIALEKFGILKDVLDVSNTERRVFINEWICEVGIAVAKALDYAHARNVLHRDVKPANIIITEEKHVKLLDFSIARDVNQTMGRTAAGMVFGTVQYMSPEQILSNPLDGRTDIYSLGCTLYHMATSKVPFVDDNDITVCMCHVNQPPDKPSTLNPNLSSALEEVILQCMSKRPRERFESAAQLATALNAVLHGTQTLVVRPDELPPPKDAPPKRHPSDKKPSSTGDPRARVKKMRPKVPRPKLKPSSPPLPTPEPLPRYKTEQLFAPSILDPNLQDYPSSEPESSEPVSSSPSASSPNPPVEPVVSAPPKSTLPPVESKPVLPKPNLALKMQENLVTSVPKERLEETRKERQERRAKEQELRRDLEAQKDEEGSTGSQFRKPKKPMGLEEMAKMAEEKTGKSSKISEGRFRPSITPSAPGSSSAWMTSSSGTSNHQPSSLTEAVFAPEDTAIKEAAKRRRMLMIAGFLGALFVVGIIAAGVSFVSSLDNDDSKNNGGTTPVETPTPTPEPTKVALVRPTMTPLPDSRETPEPVKPTKTATPTPTPVPTPETLPVPTPPTPLSSIHTFRVPLDTGIELVMAELPPGEFVMGSPLDEYSRHEDEGPLTKVQFELPFYMSQTEISRAQWRAVMGQETIAGSPHLPMSNITHREAEEYCQKLSDMTGITFRLPTEAQWEYACRATTTTPFTFGPIITSDLANINGQEVYPLTPLSENAKDLQPVSELPPNLWGLYGVHGNVWEFTRGYYTVRLPGSKVTNPQPPSKGVEIVLRGGSYLEGPAEARSAARQRVPFDTSGRNIGFRVVAEL